MAIVTVSSSLPRGRFKCDSTVGAADSDHVSQIHEIDDTYHFLLMTSWH